jgi:hypothetical protein
MDLIDGLPGKVAVHCKEEKEFAWVRDGDCPLSVPAVVLTDTKKLLCCLNLSQPTSADGKSELEESKEPENGPDTRNQHTATGPGVGAACSLDGKTGGSDPRPAVELPKDVHQVSHTNDGLDWDDGGLGYCYASEEEEYDPDAYEGSDSWDSQPSTGESLEEVPSQAIADQLKEKLARDSCDEGEAANLRVRTGTCLAQLLLLSFRHRQ